MAIFTITVQQLAEDGFDFGLTEDDYPLFPANLRGVKDDEGRWQFVKVTDDDGMVHFFGLNKLILDHFWHREIGMETEQMWRFYLNKKLREIMPYYNQLLKSETLKFDPFQTQDTTHTNESAEHVADQSHNTTTAHNATESDAVGRVVQSQFPQTALSRDADYASSGADNNSQTTGTTDTTGSGDNTRNMDTNGNVTMHTTGSQGHTAALLMQYRRSFLNIGMMVVNELETLFMQVMDSNDSHMNERNGNYGPFGLGYPYFFPTS